MSNHAIRKFERLVSLSSDERRALEELPMAIRAFPGRTDVVREGDSPGQCALLLDGWACCYKLVGAGQRQILSFHVAGDLLGLHGLFLPTLDHTIRVLTEARIAFISHRNLLELAARHSGIGAALWRHSLVDAAVFREWLVGMGQRSAVQRVAHLFCELYAKCEAAGLARELALPTPHHAIGPRRCVGVIAGACQSRAAST